MLHTAVQCGMHYSRHYSLGLLLLQEAPRVVRSRRAVRVVVERKVGRALGAVGAPHNAVVELLEEPFTVRVRDYQVNLICYTRLSRVPEGLRVIQKGGAAITCNYK